MAASKSVGKCKEARKKTERRKRELWKENIYTVNNFLTINIRYKNARVLEGNKDKR